MRKPLGRKAYGSIPHLPGSRTGPTDSTIHEGQARICTEKERPGDTIIVQEKLDGSCVAVAKVDGVIVPLMRAGHRADDSRFRQHHMFAAWVCENQERFDAALGEGQRLCGEWLAQAHGTRYEITGDPFVAFDMMIETTRFPLDVLMLAAGLGEFTTPRLIHDGGAISIEDVISQLEPSGHGALDPVEGAVWRVERTGGVDFLAKWVRPEKVDGCYFPQNNGGAEVWNWTPQGVAA